MVSVEGAIDADSLCGSADTSEISERPNGGAQDGDDSEEESSEYEYVYEVNLFFVLFCFFFPKNK